MISRPSKRVFHFDYFNEIGDRFTITFNSVFDSGNLCLVEQVTSTSYTLHTSPDFDEANPQSICRSWFYFSVSGVPAGTTLTFTVKRVNILYTLFRTAPDTYKPVYRIGDGPWKRLENTAKLIEDPGEKSINVEFEHTFEQVCPKLKPDLEDQKTKETFFAFSFPFSYKECQEMINEYQAIYSNDPDIYFHHEVFIRSPHKRRVNLITISSHDDKLEETEPYIGEGLFPNRDQTPRAFRFAGNKPLVLLTARVHPGESPSSYAMNGILKLLLNKQDPRAQILRKNFVFLLIPMLNPDGVYHGHYRLDVHGQNLNRHYRIPDQEKQPSVYGVKRLVQHLHSEKRLLFYTDLHSHASTKGAFFYGNALNTGMQVETYVFANLMSINHPSFKFDQCNFSRRHMNARDRGEKLTKEGAGRVCVYRICNIPHSYTLECGFHYYYKNDTGNSFRPKTPSSLCANSSMESLSPLNKNNPTYFTIETYEDVGKALLISLIDLYELNPSPEIINTKYGSINGLRADIVANFPKINFDGLQLRTRCPSLSGSIVKAPPTEFVRESSTVLRRLPDLSAEKRVILMNQTQAPTQLQHKRSKELGTNLYSKIGEFLSSMVLDRNQTVEYQPPEPEPKLPPKMKKMGTPKKIKLKKLAFGPPAVCFPGELDFMMDDDKKNNNKEILPKLWDSGTLEGHKPSLYESIQFEEQQETFVLHSVPKEKEAKSRGRVFSYRGQNLNDQATLIESPKLQSEKKESLPPVHHFSKPRTIKKKHLLKPLIKAIVVKKSLNRKNDQSELKPLSRTAQDDIGRISVEGKHYS